MANKDHANYSIENDQTQIYVLYSNENEWVIIMGNHKFADDQAYFVSMLDEELSLMDKEKAQIILK